MVPDYWSCLGVDLCFDEMSRTYLNLTTNLRKLYPPTTGTMILENMPGYHRPTIRSSLTDKTVSPAKLACMSDADVEPTISPLLTAITLDASGGHHYCLHTAPILNGLISPADIDNSTKPMYHSYVTALAAEVSLYLFVISGFNSGHFIPCTLTTIFPFEVVAATDTCLCGHTLFKQLTNYPQITDLAPDLLRAPTADSPHPLYTGTSFIHTASYGTRPSANSGQLRPKLPAS
jgi:hypothetical protein